MNNVVLSPVAMSIFGTIEVSDESITNYGYALLAIAGADHEISELEYQWLQTNFCELLFIPRHVESKFQLFDFRNADIEKILSKINIKSEVNIKMLLIYHSMQMATADNNFHKKERIALEKAAKLLGISEYQVHAIEHLTKVERSLTDMRKALFEVKEEAPNIKIDKDIRYKMNSWVTLNFGHTYTTYESLKAYYQLLLIICGSDGKVADSEMEWLEMTALIAGTPPDIIESLRSYDYKNGDVAKLFSRIVTDTHQNMQRISLYWAMLMCRADGIYADKERKSIEDAADLLNVEHEVIDYLENLVEVEISVEGFKKRLLS